MKICITAQGSTLDAPVDPRFGRCQFFIIVDTDTMKHEVISNEAGAGGAGIQAGQLMADKGVHVVLTGNVGPNAFRTLEAAGIRTIIGVSGVIRDIVKKYQDGEYTETASGPNVESHFGTTQ